MRREVKVEKVKIEMKIEDTSEVQERYSEGWEETKIKKRKGKVRK